MPHLTVLAAEAQLAGHEDTLITALTDAVVSVYGDWARPLVVIRLVGVPTGRWAVGGVATDAPHRRWPSASAPERSPSPTTSSAWEAR